MKLIDKDALLAEIEKLKAEALQKKSQCKRSGLEKIMHQIGAYNKVLSFIDTLEVKEVDLNKEIDHVWDNLPDTFLTSQHWSEFQKVAKHFFELGLNASNPLTDVNLDSMQDDYVSLLESRGMKHEEAVIASASYANGVNDVLKRFKERKEK